MKQAIFAFLLVLFSANFFLAEARIFRVGYNGTSLVGVDYPTIDAAQAVASNGDTIQVYSNQGGNISKQLVIMGFGYNLDAHPSLQAIGLDAPSPIGISFMAGSENSIVEGCNGTVNLFTSNITIKRFLGMVHLYPSSNEVSNIKVISSVLTSVQMVTTNFPCINLQIYNSIINGHITMYLPGTSGSIINCSMVDPTQIGYILNLNNAGFLVKNSIIGYNANNTNTIWENNVFRTAQPASLPQGSNNLWSQSWTTVFTGTSTNQSYTGNENFNETYYILKEGSPAINFGIDSQGNPTDCGIFGGEMINRYKLGGIPAVPAIYQIATPGSATSTNPYNVTISVRSNN